ncbi:LysR family transcriptional regulator substrate-binding protein [Lacrimispora sp.]|uniref:LysR family transcriptional regulator substrate-binding protein n=1 Tax=Lacrimispora sp. TaxID=2719234 RepID=UPI003FA5492C
MIDDTTILSMVEKGVGISIIPKLTTLRTSYQVRFVEIAPPHYRHLGIVTRKGEYSPWAIKTFIKFAMSSRMSPSL